MNGRVYEPTLGRFLSADLLVQSPFNTQSYNRYSYVFNNPLSFTDPSGFACVNGMSVGLFGCGDSRAISVSDGFGDFIGAGASPLGIDLQQHGLLAIDSQMVTGPFLQLTQTDNAIGAPQLLWSNGDGSYTSGAEGTGSPGYTITIEDITVTANGSDRPIASTRNGEGWWQLGDGLSGHVRYWGPDFFSTPSQDDFILSEGVRRHGNREYGKTVFATTTCSYLGCWETFVTREEEPGGHNTDSMSLPFDPSASPSLILHSHRSTNSHGDKFGPGDHIPIIKHGLIPYIRTSRLGVYKVLEGHSGYLWERTLNGWSAGKVQKWKRTMDEP